MYSVRKSKKILRSLVKQYRRKKKKLASENVEKAKTLLQNLQNAILSNSREEADQHAREAEVFFKHIIKKTIFDQFFEIVFALGFALFIAIVIRQMWFELYEIPTGSMRPTLQEKDRLLVSKSQFSVNFPLKPTHAYFNPEDVERNGIIVFTGAGMDITDVDTLYFYIFPGKKQYIKRLIGKPGDRLYFHGGRIYGIDKNGKDISNELNPPMLKDIDHVPYIYFDGKVVTPVSTHAEYFSPAVIYQMNQPVAKMSVNAFGQINHQILYNKNALAGLEYYDLWGFKNYGVTRILSAKEMRNINHAKTDVLGNADYYLQIAHHPNFANASMQKDLYGRLRPTLGIMNSFMALDSETLHKLFDNLYTARFIVEKGYARRYGSKPITQHTKHFYPYLPGIPDGTYEFEKGKAYQVKFQGIRTKLSKQHPLSVFDAKRLVTLFNIGIEFDTRYNPGMLPVTIFPSRYAYFENDDLYLMGRKILSHESVKLLDFIRNEEEKEKTGRYYKGFLPSKPPFQDGKIDKEFVEKYGIQVPENEYLVLGDNYAMSADSRDFGFVPSGNLRGVPEYIFWPPGSRLGYPLQAKYATFTTSRLIIWFFAFICFGLWYIYHRKYHTPPYDDLK